MWPFFLFFSSVVSLYEDIYPTSCNYDYVFEPLQALLYVTFTIHSFGNCVDLPNNI